MPDTTWINGRFVERAGATVSAFDAGVVHAVGLFETMLAARGRVVRVDAHLARLTASAKELGLTESLNARALQEAVHAVVERSGLATGDARARVRLTLTGGDLNLLQSGAQTQTDPTIIISATPATTYPDEMFERGVGVLIAETKANPLNPFEGHKTLNYWWRLRELQRAAASHMGEALILQVTNHVAGGAVSNLFAVSGGTLLTPIAHTEETPGAMGSPVLPGVTRAAVVELAEAMGVGCDKRLLTIDDLLDADELFLTNSSWGVLPVTTVERRAIGGGAPGELTGQLRARWLETLSPEP
jgi:branched-chain amino acid aminotransferase